MTWTVWATSGPPFSAEIVYATVVPSTGVALDTLFDRTTSATAAGVIIAEACCVPVTSGVLADCDSVAVLTSAPSPVST